MRFLRVSVGFCSDDSGVCCSCFGSIDNSVSCSCYTITTYLNCNSLYQSWKN